MIFTTFVAATDYCSTDSSFNLADMKYLSGEDYAKVTNDLYTITFSKVETHDNYLLASKDLNITTNEKWSTVIQTSMTNNNSAFGLTNFNM